MLSFPMIFSLTLKDTRITSLVLLVFYARSMAGGIRGLRSCPPSYAKNIAMSEAAAMIMRHSWQVDQIQISPSGPKGYKPM